MKFKAYKQISSTDCGPCCLKMIAEFHNKKVDLKFLHKICAVTNEGVSLYGISIAAKELGFKTDALSLDIEALYENFSSPCILHWQLNHFVVLYDIFIRKGKRYYRIGNPAFGSIFILSEQEFVTGWLCGNSNSGLGIALMLAKSHDFNTESIVSSNDILSNSRDRILSCLFKHKNDFLFICIVVFLSLIFQLILPFTSQYMVDKGIAEKQLNIIYVILFGQFALISGQTICGFIRGWLILNVGIKINIELLSDYLAKLMSLPISFFDSKFAGDIMQRINDHYRIQYFLTDNFIDTIFALATMIVFGGILIYYNIYVALIYLLGGGFYFGWLLLFMNKRAIIDHKMFSLHSSNQNSLMQLIYGMQEIKLNTCEIKKLKGWQTIQHQIRDFSRKGLKINQYQQSGCNLINQSKDLMITAFVSTLVVADELTLGMMLSIQYIIGVLNAPILQLVSSLRQYQDARLSIERLSDVYTIAAEDSHIHDNESKTPDAIPGIALKNVTFKYDKIEDHNTIDDISLEIPNGKVTAIVGLSGSGKTTLMKLLLGFYTPDQGDVLIDGRPLRLLSKRWWRGECGIVMQDGYIFSDTIENNIAVAADKIDYGRLYEVCRIANILDFINDLPLGFQTIVGNDGKGISLGQKQRILIARALYKQPKYIFFDEATNSLDSENESVITKNLETEFFGKTVVIIAHRLSTIRKADQIIVIKDGRIIERGTHEDLIKSGRLYYSLVKEQLNI